MACFAEFRGEDEVALDCLHFSLSYFVLMIFSGYRHYQDAYETLTIMFGSTAILPPHTLSTYFPTRQMAKSRGTLHFQRGTVEGLPRLASCPRRGVFVLGRGTNMYNYFHKRCSECEIHEDANLPFQWGKHRLVTIHYTPELAEGQTKHLHVTAGRNRHSL